MKTHIRCSRTRRIFCGAFLFCSVLLASPPEVRAFTDSDGDTYSVKVTGPGFALVFRNVTAAEPNGPIASILLTGTDATSVLTIAVSKVGDGRVRVGQISGSGPVGMIVATKCDLGIGGIRIGSLGSLHIGDVADGASLVLPARQRVRPLVFTARDVGAMQLTAPSHTLTFTARSVTGGAQISARRSRRST